MALGMDNWRYIVNDFLWKVQEFGFYFVINGQLGVVLIQGINRMIFFKDNYYVEGIRERL